MESRKWKSRKTLSFSFSFDKLTLKISEKLARSKTSGINIQLEFNGRTKKTGNKYT